MACFLFFVRPAQARFRQAADFQAALRQNLAVARARVDQAEGYLRRFVHEDEFRRRVLRERMGYAEDGEFVYIFEN
jgi:hypothetical protein